MFRKSTHQSPYGNFNEDPVGYRKRYYAANKDKMREAQKRYQAKLRGELRGATQTLPPEVVAEVEEATLLPDRRRGGEEEYIRKTLELESTKSWLEARVLRLVKEDPSLSEDDAKQLAEDQWLEGLY